jgi:hypothetical protein
VLGPNQANRTDCFDDNEVASLSSKIKWEISVPWASFVSISVEIEPPSRKERGLSGGFLASRGGVGTGIIGQARRLGTGS